MICGRALLMPEANVHITDPARTVSTRQQASLTLGIPRNWRGSPNSAVFTHQSPDEGASNLTLTGKLRQPRKRLSQTEEPVRHVERGLGLTSRTRQVQRP